MLPPNVYYQRNAPDPVLDERTVMSIVRRHMPQATSLTGVDESGGEARAYAVDEDVILKVQRPQQLRSNTSLEKEVFFLQQLASHPDISVPRVLGYGKEPGIEYICMTRMSGVPARSVDLPNHKRAELLRRLGRTLRRIHSIPQDPFYSSPLFPGMRSRDAFVERMKVGFAEAVQALHANPALWPLNVTPADLAAGALSTIPQRIDLVALHSNPGPEHVFVDPDTFEFTGLIDFGDAYIGHPAIDCRWPRHEDRLALLHAYCEDKPDAAEFIAPWRSVRLLYEMSALSTRPYRRQQATENLKYLIAGVS